MSPAPPGIAVSLLLGPLCFRLLWSSLHHSTRRVFICLTVSSFCCFKCSFVVFSRFLRFFLSSSVNSVYCLVERLLQRVTSEALQRQQHPRLIDSSLTRFCSCLCSPVSLCQDIGVGCVCVLRVRFLCQFFLCLCAWSTF